MVRGMDRAGKTVLRAQMVRIGDRMIRARRPTAIRIYVMLFIV